MTHIGESFETFCADPQLIGEPISKPWAIFYKAVEGLPLDADEQETFFLCTGRSDDYSPHVYTEATAICGRRSEKTSTAVKFALWKSLFGGFESRVRPGELLRVPIVCQDLRIAKDVLRTVRTFLRNSPVLINEIDEDLATEIRLRNGLSFTSYPCTVSAPRGLSCPIAICDELAFWQIETGANPDVEILRALRPAMILFGQERRLLKISTPWMRAGVLFDEYSQRSERDLLVWQASTERMSPRVSRAELEKERAADPAYFAREYEAVFTDDTEAFLPSGDIDLAVRSGAREIPFVGILKGNYSAAIDASGLSGKDRFTFSIGHRAVRGKAGEGISFDVLRGWQRQAVGIVCDEIAALLKAYELRSVIADQFGFSFLRELLSQRGIEVVQLPFTARSKPEIFLDLKLALSQGRISLLDHAESLRELRMLESKRTSGGNYSISAPRGQHDDYATVIALLAHRSKTESAETFAYLSIGGHGTDFSRDSRGEPTQYRKPQPLPPDSPQFWRKRGSL